MYYIFLVFFGVLGALLRYTVTLWMNADFPLATLIVNVAGCFLLAFLTQFLSEIACLSKKLISAIGTGFVGSFTTFSTFTLESSELLYLSDYISAVSYMLASLIFGLVACALGYRTSKLLLARKERRISNGA